MRRIVHLSDLHFGRARPELLIPLQAAVTQAAPDLVVISGDLTQRARSREFRQARGFLDALPAPWMAVPGNHDVPLYNLGARLFRPFRKYRKWIAAELEPVHADDDIAVVGVNTVDPRRHQRGRIGARATRRICALFEGGPPRRLNIVLGHHPFEQAADARKTPMRGAPRALDALMKCNAHVVLSGHLHRWRAGRFLTGIRAEGPIQIHSGTSLSSRLRGAVNDFAVLDVEDARVTVRRMMVDDTDLSFAEAECTRFRRGPGGLSLLERGAAESPASG